MQLSFRFLPLALLSAAAWANGPADLQASLQRLQGHTPVKADFSCDVRQEQTSFLSPSVQAFSGRIQVAETEAGLHADWNPAAAVTPRGEATMELGPAMIRSLLNPSDALTNLLGDSQFKSENLETYQGHRVRVLAYVCKPRIQPQHQGRVQQAESSLKIWIGDDGVPLAAEWMVDYTGRHSRLYGRIHSTSLVRTTFTVVDQRLLVASRTVEDFTYDYGDKLKRTENLTLAAKG